MNKIIFLFLFIFLVNCNKSPVLQNHGVPFLLDREEDLILEKTNKNDTIKLLGYPSVKSSYNENMWIYIERVKTRGKLLDLGKNVVKSNNTLVLEFNKYDILIKKDSYDINNLNDNKFTEKNTAGVSKDSDFIYNFLSSLRQKIQDPLNKRKSKIKK